jgi:Protein of unknown function (DUF2628)
VRLYTVQGVPETAAAQPPVLLREGFSVYPFLFGFLWFLSKRLWREAALLFALTIAAGLLLPDPAAGIAVLALHIVAGFEGRDRQRARLARKGMAERAVIAAPNLDMAWARLVAQRPDLVRAAP